MVIHDFDLMWPVLKPSKANAPLRIDANAVLSFSITFECFQHIAGWHPKAFQISGSMQDQQFASGHSFYVGKSRYLLAAK